MGNAQILFEFALYKEDGILIRGAVFISEQEETNVFGDHLHFEESAIFGTEHAIVQRSIFKGLILRYQFSLPSSNMTIRYLDVQQDFSTGKWKQKEVFSTALQIGVHDSDDWENIGLGFQYPLAFRCKVH